MDIAFFKICTVPRRAICSIPMFPGIKLIFFVMPVLNDFNDPITTGIAHVLWFSTWP